MTKLSIRIGLIAAAVSVVLVLVGCGRSETLRVSFTVEGMTCESCSSAITDSLTKIDGVEHAEADHVAGTARAIYVSPRVKPELLEAQIESLGYTVTGIEIAPVEG
jgi:copper chaperone CopZ